MTDSIKADKYVLFNPGPVNISERVRLSLNKIDLCHREEEFNALLQSIRQKLLCVYGLNDKKYASVVLTGSGTAAVEAAIASLCPLEGQILVVSNGIYGERIAKMASVNNIKIEEIRYQWGERIKINDLEKKIIDNPQITAIAVVHHETTTGILNRLADIGKLAVRYNKEFFIDAVSSFGGEEIRFDEWGVDICCGTANKCIHGAPGASFVISKREIFERQRDAAPKSVYLDLVNCYYHEEKGIPPFTPCVQVMYAFEEALNELLEKGVEERIRLYQTRANLIRKLGKDIGLKPYLPFNEMCNTLTSFYLPSFITYEKLHDILKEQGYVIYAGQGGLYKNIFRIANLGEISLSDIEKLFEAIKEAIVP